MIINYLKNIGYMLIGILVTTIIITILNYFGILNGNLLKIVLVITMVLSLFIGGYLTGRKANKKGYLEGIKIGLIMIVIILLFNLFIFRNEFSLINILYYISLVFSSMVGSMVGIMKKSV